MSDREKETYGGHLVGILFKPKGSMDVDAAYTHPHGWPGDVSGVQVR